LQQETSRSLSRQAAAANARHPASLLARHPAALQTSSAKRQTAESNFSDRCPERVAVSFQISAAVTLRLCKELK